MRNSCYIAYVAYYLPWPRQFRGLEAEAAALVYQGLEPLPFHGLRALVALRSWRPGRSPTPGGHGAR